MNMAPFKFDSVTCAYFLSVTCTPCVNSWCGSLEAFLSQEIIQVVCVYKRWMKIYVSWLVALASRCGMPLEWLHAKKPVLSFLVICCHGHGAARMDSSQFSSRSPIPSQIPTMIASRIRFQLPRRRRGGAAIHSRASPWFYPTLYLIELCLSLWGI